MLGRNWSQYVLTPQCRPRLLSFFLLKIPFLVPFQLVQLECSHRCNILETIGHGRPLGRIAGPYYSLGWVHFWENIYSGKNTISTYILPDHFLFRKKIYFSQQIIYRCSKKSWPWDTALLYFCKSFFVFLQVFSARSHEQLTSDLKNIDGGPKLISFGPKRVTCLTTRARSDLLDVEICCKISQVNGLSLGWWSSGIFHYLLTDDSSMKHLRLPRTNC